MTMEQDFVVKLLGKMESELFLLTNRYTDVEELFLEVSAARCSGDASWLELRRRRRPCRLQSSTLIGSKLDGGPACKWVRDAFRGRGPGGEGSR